MVKVVVDTHVFVSSFLGAPAPAKVMQLWRDGVVTLCLSQAIVDEYMDVLVRLVGDADELRELLDLFARGYNDLFTVHAPTPPLVGTDPGSDKFIACAVALDCNVVITGDRHLRSVRRYVDIDILSPAEFVDLQE